MTEDTKICRDSDQVPTRELLKAQRKRDYQKSKTMRRENRLIAKAEAAAQKRQRRDQRDAELWQLIKTAKEVNPE